MARNQATDINRILKPFPALERTVDQIFTYDDLADRLADGRSLRIKYGVDLTAPFLHIGHAVNLWAMRELQEAGHTVVFLIGDFTTRIGDPTDKSETRPRLPAEEIERNAEGFIAQVRSILRTDPDVFEIRRNSEWWDPMPLTRFLELLSLVTHSRLLQRDMFQRRIDQGAEIHVHELLYPILQGYDSYELESDLTIVGTDQLFNELMGRFYQERLGALPQTVITTKITPGIDGREKQSKSLGNYIAITDTPRDKFGKAMSLPDGLTTEFLEVYTLVPMDDIAELEAKLAAGELNPMEAKKLLARALVERYHGADTAAREEEWFTAVFSERAIPADIPTVTVHDRQATVLEILELCSPSESKSQLRRLMEQGAVRLGDDRRLTDGSQRGAVRDGDVIRIGKRSWCRVSFSDDHGEVMS